MVLSSTFPVEKLSRMATSIPRSDVGKQLISSVLPTEYSIDGNCDVSSSFPQDELGKRLDPYMLQLLTRKELIHNNPTSPAGTQYRVPSLAMVNGLIISFFRNFTPLYPIVDQVHFRALYKQDQHDQQSRALIYVVLAVGAATAKDMIYQQQTANVKSIRESMFSQAMAFTPVLHGQETLQNVQILLLISFYFSAINSLNSAWFWCGCAIRLLKRCGQQRHGMLEGIEDQNLKDRLLCSVFILEKQLAILQFQADIILTIEDVDSLGETLQTQNSTLFLRFQLACLTHRFCVLLQPACLNPIDLADKIEQLYVDVSSWRDSLQSGCQPGGDLQAESNERQFVLLLHLEYHGLLAAMFTTLETTARLLPRYTIIKKHSSVRIRNHATIRMNNVRRLLYTVNGIVESDQGSSQTLCWLNITQILPSFAMLYAQVLKRPSLLSARSDVELLVVTAQVINHYLSETPEEKRLSAIIQSMAAEASNTVNRPSTSSRGRIADDTLNRFLTTSSSSNVYHTSTSPSSFHEKTATTSDTPLSFYFSLAPVDNNQALGVGNFQPHPTTHQVEQETFLLAEDDVTAPSPPDSLPTNFNLWFPPY